MAATGLHPFNPERVLKDIPRPPAEVVSTGAAVTNTGTPDVTVQTPTTPVTPVTAEALISLHNKIMQDTSVADETKTCIKKLANAAQISFAERNLLKDRNRFLFKTNSEAKARRLTRSIVLGKAKVMKFMDLEAEKARHAAIAAQKGQRIRKRKQPVSEALPPTIEAVQTREGMGPDQTQASCWQIPVARMYREIALLRRSGRYDRSAFSVANLDRNWLATFSVIIDSWFDISLFALSCKHCLCMMQDLHPATKLRGIARN